MPRTPNTRLGKIRHCAGYTQKDVATIYGVEPSYIGRLEIGNIGISLEWARRLANLYKVTLDDIYSRPYGGDYDNSTPATNITKAAESQASVSGYVSHLEVPLTDEEQDRVNWVVKQVIAVQHALVKPFTDSDIHRFTSALRERARLEKIQEGKVMLSLASAQDIFNILFLRK